MRSISYIVLPRTFAMSALILSIGVPITTHSQKNLKMTTEQRALAKEMLSDVADDVRKNYYDPKLRGLDWPALVKQTKAQVEAAPDLATANAEIAALLEKLQDSHTFFAPPRNANKVDYGWNFRVIGNRCFVTNVKDDSDAARQGVKPGDEVLTINGFTADRASSWRLHYTLGALMPRNMLHLYLRTPEGKIRQLDVASKVKPPTHTPLDYDVVSWHRDLQYEKAMDALKPKVKDLGPKLMVAKIPEFIQQGGDVDGLFKEARKHDALVIDLRGNPGGLEDSVVRYLDDLLTTEVKIAIVSSRNDPHVLTAKPNRGSLYQGQLFVLIDSESASSSEIFARTVQLQHRGTILGDISSGDTEEAQHHAFRGPMGAVYFDSVTTGDMIMVDGNPLEGKGVVPDEIVLPTASDLANGRDVLLAGVAAKLGVELTAEAAGKLFPPDKDPE